MTASTTIPVPARVRASYVATMEPGSIRDRSKEQRKALVAQFVAARNVREVPGVLTSRRGVIQAFSRFCYEDGAAAFQDYCAATGNTYRPKSEDVLSDMKAILGSFKSTSYHGGTGDDWGRCIPLQLDTFSPTEDPSSIDVLPVLPGFQTGHDRAGVDDAAFIDLLCEQMVNAGCSVDGFGRFYRFDGARWATTTESSFRTVVEANWMATQQLTLRPRQYQEVARQISATMLTKARLRSYENANVVLNNIHGKNWIEAYPAQNAGIGTLPALPIDWNDVDPLDHQYRPAARAGDRHPVLSAIFQDLDDVTFDHTIQAVVREAHVKFVQAEQDQLRDAVEQATAEQVDQPVRARARARL